MIFAAEATSPAASRRSLWVAPSGSNSRPGALRRSIVATTSSPAVVFSKTRSPPRIRVSSETRLSVDRHKGLARAAFRGDAPGPVEGGGIEPFALGEPGWRQPGSRRQPIQRAPDLVVGQHPLPACLTMKGPARRSSGKLSSNQPVFRFSRKRPRPRRCQAKSRPVCVEKARQNKSLESAPNFIGAGMAVTLEFGGGGLYGRAGF